MGRDVLPPGLHHHPVRMVGKGRESGHGRILFRNFFIDGHRGDPVFLARDDQDGAGDPGRIHFRGPPGIQEPETNRFNKLAELVYHQAVKGLIEATDRASFYTAADFDIRPPRDDHPFFFHFFKWEQTPQVLAAYGHTWQPFGGSGYLVTFALLALTVVLSFSLILLPLLWLRKPGVSGGTGVERLVFLTYYSLLGFGFLFIEIPLIQKTMLLLGHPTRAFTVVVSNQFSVTGLYRAPPLRLPPPYPPQAIISWPVQTAV